MKTSNVLKGIIVSTGILLTYIKYNYTLLLDEEYLMIFLITTLVLFIASILILNIYFFRLKTNVDLLKLKSFILNNKNLISKSKERIRNHYNRSNPLEIARTSELFKWVLSTVLIAVLLGYFFKKPNAQMLKRAMLQNSEWKKDVFLESMLSETTFFEMNTYKVSVNGSFEFNWFAFCIGLFFMIMVYFVLKKTTLITVLKSKINPYLK